MRREGMGKISLSIGIDAGGHQMAMLDVSFVVRGRGRVGRRRCARPTSASGAMHDHRVGPSRRGPSQRSTPAGSSSRRVRRRPHPFGSDLLAEPWPRAPSGRGSPPTCSPTAATGLRRPSARLQDIEQRAAAFDIEVTWRTVGEYFQRVEAARPSINMVPMVSQGSVRMAVMGRARRAVRGAAGAMKEHIGEAMQQRRPGHVLRPAVRTQRLRVSIDELVELAKHRPRLRRRLCRSHPQRRRQRRLVLRDRRGAGDRPAAPASRCRSPT